MNANIPTAGQNVDLLWVFLIQFQTQNPALQHHIIFYVDKAEAKALNALNKCGSKKKKISSRE